MCLRSVIPRVADAKTRSVLEELAYRDTWGRGADSYLAMLLSA